MLQKTMKSYENRGRVTDVGGSGIQAVFHQLFHGSAEVQHNLPRADAMDRPAVDGPDGPGGLRAGERGTANQGGERAANPTQASPSEPQELRGSRNRDGGRGTARARSTAPVRGAKRPGRGVRRPGPGPVPDRCTHSPGRSRLHRGPGGAGHAALF